MTKAEKGKARADSDPFWDSDESLVVREYADGKRTYDLLMDLLDPKLVKFQFQVITISKGFDPIEYFTKYPGRFISMHAQGWNAETKKMAPIGQDSLDWKKIFAAAKSAGIKNYFVEMNLDLMKASVPYLRNLQV